MIDTVNMANSVPLLTMPQAFLFYFLIKHTFSAKYNERGFIMKLNMQKHVGQISEGTELVMLWVHNIVLYTNVTSV